MVKGRLEIIDKFQVMLVNDVRETAHEIGDDNMHDLLGRFPWLLNPEWQVLAEEQSLTKQLQEWGTKDIGKDDRSRYDFLALENDRTLVVLEIKRPGHAIDVDDTTRLTKYRERLAAANTRPEIHMVLI